MPDKYQPMADTLLKSFNYSFFITKFIFREDNQTESEYKK
ncbi:hypothetical protein PMCN03_1493 [Pasteurella multocida subsp. multocida str. HB03]|nr:hypothetical protein PMCN03_1493 [Pasteurella multocida subsp. multocida str. HB03]